MTAGLSHRSAPAATDAVAGQPRRVAPPVDRIEFWATQALVLLVAGGHAALEVTQLGATLESLEFVPVSLFLVPAVYAALNFGLRGAAPTVIWCTILTIPNVILWHAGLGRIGELIQISFVVSVGLLVGNRIDREQRARDDAEHRELARRASEERYRALFEAISEATLVLGPDGTIEEANGAMATLFDTTPAALRGRTLDSLVGGETVAAALRRPAQDHVCLRRPDGAIVWAQPLVSAVDAAGARIQLVLHDVTHQREREEDLQAYARHTLTAREEERGRIARDLHDGPVQSLVHLWRQLDRLEQSVPDGSQPLVVEARSLAEEIADELRRFSRELRPSILDDLGLGPALRSETAAFSERSGTRVRYSESGGQAYSLAPEAELMLLRIVQEALRNIERHAHASTALVRVTYGAAALRVTVRDYGVGFEPADNPRLVASGRLGIAGMRERVRIAGGELRIRSSPGCGTTVSILVPAGGAPSVRRSPTLAGAR